MFKTTDNEKIGAYIAELIEKKFKSTRQFCKAYLEAENRIINNEELRKMANRLSQIKKGAKSIQTYDLPVFTRLLEVTCEEILSAGECFVPDANRMTNYRFAFTKDKKVWEKYINREDKIILNTDEYGKTVIDYALQCKNYDLLKYLTDKKYIWFVGADEKDYMSGIFGAGTSIERKLTCNIDILDIRLAGNDKLRRQMISLAIDNDDFEMLTELRAREIPSLYQACYLACTPVDCDKYYDKDMLKHIANADEKILDYFSEEFEIKDRIGRINSFIFPYMSNLIELLIASNHPYSETLLKRSIAHNKSAYGKLQKLITAAVNSYDQEDFEPLIKAEIKKDVLKQLDFYKDGNIINFRDRFYHDGMVTNIIAVKGRSKSEKINCLIDELNASYEKIINIKQQD